MGLLVATLWFLVLFILTCVVLFCLIITSQFRSVPVWHTCPQPASSFVASSSFLRQTQLPGALPGGSLPVPGDRALFTLLSYLSDELRNTVLLSVCTWRYVKQALPQLSLGWAGQYMFLEYRLPLTTLPVFKGFQIP